MKSFQLSIILSAIAAICIYSHINATVPQLSIKENNGNFTHIQLNDGNLFRHTTGDTTFLHLNLINGKTINLNVAEIDSMTVVNPVIPSLSFSFTDYPDAEQVWTKDKYINATLSIQGNGYSEDNDSLSLKVKSRGNSTSMMKKKPMRLKFDKKTSICGFKKSKNYVLLANYIDPTHCKNVLALWLANKMGTAYCNTFMPCDVFINGKYTGLYLMTEKIGINSTSVDIDEKNGILFELDVNFDENYKFYSESYNLPVMVKDPDFDELYEDDPEGLTPDERMVLWQKDFTKAESSVKEGNGFDSFDLESFVNYMIVYNLVRNQEISFPKSIYIHKQELGDNEKYTFGPVWDFDACFNLPVLKNGEIKETEYNMATLIHPFLKKLVETPGFMEKYQERFAWFKDNVYPEMLEFLDNYSSLINESAKLDGYRWDIEEDLKWVMRIPSTNTKTHISNLKQWIINRVSYLEERTIQGKF